MEAPASAGRGDTPGHPGTPRDTQGLLALLWAPRAAERGPAMASALWPCCYPEMPDLAAGQGGGERRTPRGSESARGGEPGVPGHPSSITAPSSTGSPRTPSPSWAPLPGGSRSPAAPGSSPGAHSERGGCGRGALRAVGALLPGQTTPRRGLPAAILSLGSAPGGSGAILCRARFLFAAHPCQRRFLPGAPTGHDGRAG